MGYVRVRFSRYLILSFAIVGIYASAFVIFGDFLTHSSVWRIVAAGSFLVAVMLMVSVARQWLGRRLRSGKEK